MDGGVAHDLIQQNLLGEAIDRGPVAVFVADDQQRYLAVNAYACELLGYAREEILQLRVTDVAVNTGAAADHGEMMRAGEHVGLAILRRKDGAEVPMNFRASSTTVAGMDVYVGVCWPVAS